MTGLASRSFWWSLMLRLIGAALLVMAFLQAAAVLNRAGGAIGWAEALTPLLCVAGAMGSLAIEMRLGRRRPERAGRGRSAAVQALHRELDATVGRRVRDGQDGPTL